VRSVIPLKRSDPRYGWYVDRYGKRAWEVDALDPNVLRDCVEDAIRSRINTAAWERCKAVTEGERESLEYVLTSWTKQCKEP